MKINRAQPIETSLTAVHNAALRGLGVQREGGVVSPGGFLPVVHHHRLQLVRAGAGLHREGEQVSEMTIVSHIRAAAHRATANRKSKYVPACYC